VHTVAAVPGHISSRTAADIAGALDRDQIRRARLVAAAAARQLSATPSSTTATDMQQRQQQQHTTNISKVSGRQTAIDGVVNL